MFKPNVDVGHPIKSNNEKILLCAYLLVCMCMCASMRVCSYRKTQTLVMQVWFNLENM